MKLPVLISVPCVLVGRKEKEYESNGRKGVSYSLSVSCEGEAVNLSCDKFAYDKAGELGQFVSVAIVGEYETNYKNFKVYSIAKSEKK